MKQKLISLICLLSFSCHSLAGVGLLLSGFGISFIDNNAELKRKQQEEAQGIERHVLDPRISRWDAFSFGIAAAGIIVGGTGLLAKESAMIILNDDQKSLARILTSEFEFINTELAVEIETLILKKLNNGEFQSESKDLVHISISQSEVDSILRNTTHHLNPEEIKQINLFLN